MKCMHCQGGEGDCRPEELDGDAWSVIAKLGDDGGIEIESARPLWHKHIETYALRFLEAMRLSMNVELDIEKVLDESSGTIMRRSGSRIWKIVCQPGCRGVQE